MEVIRGIGNLRDRHRGCVASIGNYDGVHKGHQTIVAQLKEQGAVLNLPVTVITFEPHPQEYFRRDQAPRRLTGFREKIMALREAKVDRVLLLRFGRHLAQMSPGEFVQKILVDGIGVRYLLVGDDFRFGKDRTGDFAFLQKAAAADGFNVDRIPTYLVNGDRVSSSRVRACLAKGDMSGARELLGRHYTISGRVVHGDKRGREWGFPTANINLERRPPPLTGIFAVRVNGLSQDNSPGVASLGTRPVVDGEHLILEVYLFDFNQDIYGKRIAVQFIEKLRDEQDFANVETLKTQIAQDVIDAKIRLRC